MHTGFIDRLRSRLSWQGFPFQLLAITFLPLTILLLVIAFGSLALHQNAMRVMVSQRDERAVRIAARSLEGQIRYRMDIIRGLRTIANNGENEQLANILSDPDTISSYFDGGLVLYHPDGELEYLAGDPKFWSSIGGQVETAIGELPELEGESDPLIRMIYHPVSGESMMLLLAPSPERERILVGVFSLSNLIMQTISPSLSGDPEYYILVASPDGEVLYESGSMEAGHHATGHPGISEALSGQTGTTVMQTGESEHVVAYSPVSPPGWALVLEEPWEMVATPTLRTTQIAPLVLVPVLILAALGLWFGARRIVRPIQKLEARAASLAWGNFTAIEEPVGGIAEIRHLQAELIHMAHKLQEAQRSLHNYIGAITAAQEEERRRLARELHDDTIQSLIALKQRLQLVSLTQQDESTTDSLEEVERLTEQNIESLRRLTRALRPIYLEDLGLPTALEMLVRETNLTTNIEIGFEQNGSEKRLEPDIELALYRMTQEALNNTIHHSNATRAGVGISYTDQEVSIQVSDDGQGFEMPVSPGEFARKGHFGLLGLYERAGLIGAELVIRSAPGKGAQVMVHFPVMG